MGLLYIFFGVKQSLFWLADNILKDAESMQNILNR